MSQNSNRSFPWLQYFVSCVHMKEKSKQMSEPNEANEKIIE